MKTKIYKRNRQLRKEERELGRLFTNSLCEQFLADGVVQTKGKSEKEIARELLVHALAWAAQRPMLMSVDHRTPILKKARQFAKEGDHNVAALLYATWFEHWINGILTVRLPKLSEAERVRMLGETSLKGKFTWLLKLVHGVSIAAQQLETILKVAAARNSFVHHKYVLSDVDQWKNEAAEFTSLFKRSEKAITYLQKFQKKLFFSPTGRRVLAVLKSRKANRKLRTTKTT